MSRSVVLTEGSTLFGPTAPHESIERILNRLFELLAALRAHRSVSMAFQNDPHVFAHRPTIRAGQLG